MSTTKKKKIPVKKTKQHVLDTFNSFFEEFKDESDRAAVVLGAAKLDTVLYQILQKHLIPSASSKDDLMDGDSPLGSFSAKISACYRMGLIDSQMTRSLHMIRKIRNTFAHEVTGCNLTSGAHADRVKELVSQFDSYEIYTKVMESNFESEGPAEQFRICIGIVAIRLESVFLACSQISEKVQVRLIGSSWDKNG